MATILEVEQFKNLTEKSRTFTRKDRIDIATMQLRRDSFQV